jgi:bacillolysin
MRTQRIGKFSLGMALALMVMLVTIPGPATAAAPNASGFRALSGDTAANFVVPSDMRLVRSFYLATYGLTYERYQQYYGTAQVLGAQITLYRDEAGTITTVIGAHYPDIVPTNVIGLSEAAARARVERDIGAEGQRNVDLLINPTTGRYFYRLETRRFASRWFHWIDAGNGQVLNKYNGIAHADGIGVKGDTKDMSGLTTLHDTSGHGASGSHWDLFSTDNRQQTYDYGNKDPFIYYVTDEDNHWDLVTSDGQSPGHPALVDAQYYAKVTDDYLSLSHSFDWINSGCGYTAMQSIAHYNKNYNNAFWNGTYTVYGDGDGEIFRELSGGLDVVAHEHTHGVTECTSNLIYQDESGALNESFSDMLGTSAEFYAEENLLEPSAAADWFIGEDVYLPTDDEPGFRNMADL